MSSRKQHNASVVIDFGPPPHHVVLRTRAYFGELEAARKRCTTNAELNHEWDAIWRKYNPPPPKAPPVDPNSKEGKLAAFRRAMRRG